MDLCRGVYSHALFKLIIYNRIDAGGTYSTQIDGNAVRRLKIDSSQNTLS